MMTKYFIFLVIFLSLFELKSGDKNPCLIKMAPVNIIITDDGYKNIFEDVNDSCGSELIVALREYIKQYKNDLNVENIEKLFSLQFTIKKFEIISIKDFISESLQINHPYDIDHIKFLTPLSLITLEGREEIGTELLQGPELGEQNVQITLKKNRTIQNYWCTFTLQKKDKLLVATSNLSPFHENLGQYFVLKEVLISKNESYFTDWNALRFYKLNKNVPAGTPLKTTDLMAKNLVGPGQKVNIVLKKKGVLIQTTALSKTSGKLGEYISLEKERNGTAFTGKVVDYNSVRVDL